MPYTIYDTPALVMARWPHKEASSRFLLYTRELGRILAYAQSVRKTAAKLQPALQIYGIGEFELVRGKAGWRIVGAHPQHNFHLGVATHQKRMVERFVGLFGRLVPAQETNRALYEIIASGLEAITTSRTPKAAATREQLLVLRTLANLGYAPAASRAELEPFLQSTDYSPAVLEQFAPLTTAALAQINQSLETIQL